MATVKVYQLGERARSTVIAEALAVGASRCGLNVMRCKDSQYIRPDSDIAAFYGFERWHPQIMREYVADGRKVVYIDLGYFGRREGGRFDGYHKVAVNSRHPTAYFRDKPHKADRIGKFRLHCKPWKSEGFILLAGMSDKAAIAEGFAPNEWEIRAINEIRKHTDRPILYRPKPSWTGARPLTGSRFYHPTQPIEWPKIYAVVTHHSNCGVEGLIEGVPVFSDGGVASVMGLSDLSQINSPLYPDGREQWLADIGYCQWNLAEMRNGEMWRHLLDEGLV